MPEPNPTLSGTSRIEPPARVLLCLDPGCHCEFYLPLDLDEAMVCPNDRSHDVAVYSGPCIHQGEREPWEVLKDARSLTELPCECDNATRGLYRGRDGKVHCAQCDGIVADRTVVS